MTYKEMILKAQENGISSNDAMLASVDRLDEALSILEKEHPKEYWRMMRKTHGVLYGAHYDETFSMYDVGLLAYTDKQGRHRSGEYWTLDEVEQATRSKTFPQGTNKYDLYVAYNVIASDLCTLFEDEDLLEIAYTFFFCDEDSPEGKIWHYMCAMRK